MVEALQLTLVPRQGWEGALLLSLAAASEKPDLYAPGKEVGDIRLIEAASSEAGGRRGKALVSLGPTDKIKADTFRQAGGAIARWLVKNQVSGAGLDTSGLENFSPAEALPALYEGLLLGAFRFERHKSKPAERPGVALQILVEGDLSAASQVLRQAEVVCQAVNLARDLAHEPANIINPLTLAERAQLVAAENGLTCKVLDDSELEALGAGGILSVGKGSQTPARMIIMEYPGKGAGEAKPVVLVGKAITFDTGGYSLKERASMVGMKYDKCAGSAVIGLMQAVARLQLSTPVIGIVAAAENMISDKAYRPNDILITLAGKTVEVISADAEGRLVLCDALSYAQQRYQPRALIDLATLTGGVVVALGKLRAGLLSNDEDLAQALFAAGERTHERLWRLPLDEEYFELIKGDDSDFKNSGGREAHPIVGGIFLKQFVQDGTPWAHLDIAGLADSEKDQPYCPKGATGFGVRLLLDYLQTLEAEPA